MPYKIVITETGTEERVVGKNWAIIKEDGVNKVYDYTPEITKTQNFERKILEQELAHIDLAAIIRAVNGL